MPQICHRSRIDEVWVSSVRIVIGTSGAAGTCTSNGRYRLMSTSRSSTPSSTSVIVPAQVTVFETDGGKNTVSGVVQIIRSMSAQRARADHTTRSPRTTATAIPGVLTMST